MTLAIYLLLYLISGLLLSSIVFGGIAKCRVCNRRKCTEEKVFNWFGAAMLSLMSILMVIHYFTRAA